MEKTTKPKGKMKLDAAVAQALKFESCIKGIIGQAWRESWTFERILAERKRLIHDHPNWSRISGSLQSDVNRFMSGALAVLDVTCVHWQHYLDGEPTTLDEVLRLDRIRDIESRFIWTHSGEAFREMDVDMIGAGLRKRVSPEGGAADA